MENVNWELTRQNVDRFETITEQDIINKITSNKTQQVLKSLLKGEKLTGKDIWEKHGIYRASSVINRFRKRGHTIITHMEEFNGEKYARYELVQ